MTQAPANPSIVHSTTSTAGGPIAESARVTAIDVARGVALLGIFFVNAVLFGEAFSEILKPHAPVDEGFLSLLTYWFTAIFCNGKFYPLFSTLFGAGLAIMYQASQASGRNFGWIYLRRLLVLAMFGICHIFFLWSGDVLLIYSTVGLWMLLLGGRSAKTLVIVGFAVFGLGILILVGTVVLISNFDSDRPGEIAARAMPAGDTRLEQFRAVVRDWNPEEMYDSRLPALEREIMTQGPFYAAAMVRVFHYLFAIPFVCLVMFWVVFPCFCWGAALLKLGFFHGAHRDWRRRFIALGLVVGLPLNILGAIGAIMHGGIGWAMAAFAGVNIGGPMMTMMYLSLILNWVDSGLGRQWIDALANVGRMALTAYLLESLLMSAVMLHWGFALFGSTTWIDRLVWLLGIYLAIVIFCNLWIRWFRMGPMEWLWRSLTYLRWQPLLR